MSDDPETLALDGVEGYPSLTALRDANGALLARRRAGSEDANLLAAAEQFIRRGVATGALLDGSEDRRAAQSMLNFWANLLYRADRPPLDATLAEFDPLLAPELPEQPRPYLGLDAFGEDSAGKFFGRQELIGRMLERLGVERLIAVVGPSGSGKSSVVRAGLLPALQRGALTGSAEWRYLPPIVPGSDPMASLNQTLGIEGEGAQSRQQTDGAGAIPDLSIVAYPLVLVVDQFEEVFTLCDDPDNRQAFIARLLALVSAPEPSHHVILTMRSDFETFVARIPELQPLFERGRVQVTPLSAAELREAIEAPAAQVGLKFERGVVDLLLQDILGESAGLPLLQFTLLKLWEARERNRVTRAAYERVGGGRLALARSADALYQGLIPEEQVTARRILLRMVRPGEGLEITSSRVRRVVLLQGGEDPGRVARVLEKLVDARLVRLTPGEVAEDDQVEVAHEALVRNWPTLVDWLEEEKAAIATRRRLETRAAEWARLGSGEAGLLDDVEWREAERWLGSAQAHYLGYDAALPTFVAASQAASERAAQEQEAARQRELEQARELAEAKGQLADAQTRTALRLRRAAILLVVLLLAALAAASYAALQQRNAVKQQNLAQTAQALAQREATTARTAQANAQASEATAQAAKADADRQRDTVNVQRLAFAARSQFEAATETGLLLAIEAAKREANPITEQTLRDALDRYPAAAHALQGHTDAVVRAGFSPDGQRIVTASYDGTARVWDLAGKELATLQGHTAAVISAGFSPDGQRIVTASYDGTARVWDLAGKELATLQGHTAAVISAGFSPDGQRIVTASADKTARVWDLAGKELATLQGHTAAVISAGFSPDGQRIVTASADKTARVWDLAGKELATLQGHTDAVYSAGFSPDGQRIVTASYDGTARVWDLAGKELATLQGHTANVYSAGFSPDGQRIVTASADKTARVWDLAGKELATLQGHMDAVYSAGFSPDGQRIVTASYDGTARVWDLAGKELATLQGHTDAVYSAGFSPDGQRIVTASYDGTARVWDLAGKELATLQGHTDAVYSAGFSPDGQRIVTASYDGTARVWDLAGKELATLQGHTDAVNSAGFSPDGQRIVTASADKTARVWDLAGKELATLQGHTANVYSAGFSPDGQRIVTASADKTARVWDLAGKELATLQGHTANVISAGFSPDGQRIVTASADKTARVYLARVVDLLAVAACRVPRGLTDEEIQRFSVGMPRFDFTRRQCPPVTGSK